MSIGKQAFNLSLCFLEPTSMNSVLSGLCLSLLVDIHSLTSILLSYVTDGHNVGYRRHRNESLCLCVYQSVY